MADRLGQQIGSYRIIRLLGQGGFAEVYLGEHIHLKTLAAVKLLRAQLSNDETEKFRKEGSFLAHLIHPNIVRVLDFGTDRDTPFLIMDYAPNGTLRQRHPRGTRLPLATVAAYVRQVAEALQYAHEQKLVHRDIKPENMLLGRQNEILLSDFGIATMAQSSQALGTQTIAGTVTYMAPEQIEGKPRPASDQYSLSIVAYEWLTGDPPFHGSFVEITTQHMYTSPPALRMKMPSISSLVEEVIMKALAKVPDRRFANIRAFANALEQASIARTPSPSPAKGPYWSDSQQPVRTSLPSQSPSSPLVPKPPIAAGTPPFAQVGTIGVPASVPALPKPTNSLIWWPTFLVPLNERRAISDGTMQQERLSTPADLLITSLPPGPLPVSTVFTPPVTGSPGNFQYNYPIRQQGLTQPQSVINTPPRKPVVSSANIIRSTAPNSSRVMQPQPTTPPRSQQIFRSTAQSVRSSSLPQPQKAMRIAVLSFIAACVNTIVLVLAFVILNITSVVLQESPDLYNTLITIAPLTIFSLALLTFICGIKAIQNKAVGKAKTLAGSGIALSVLTALLEIVRLAAHPLV